MARDSRDWRDGALQRVHDVCTSVDETLEDDAFEVLAQLENTRRELTAEEFDRDAATEQVSALRSELIRMAHDLLDAAEEVHSLKSGSTFRNLRGKEPLNYSTPDGGAKHDAYYGMQAMNKNFMRQVSWPLRVGEWETVTPDADPARYPPDEAPTVTAEGTKKYTRTVGGRKVALVVDERGMSPI